jgi:hypothetical protein
MVLSSERLNDTLINGDKLHKLSDEELEEHIVVILEANLDRALSDHEDDECAISEEYAFHVSCSCGNFFAYKTEHEIPEENLECEICSRTVIDYIGEDDCDITYVGIDIDKMDDKVREVKERMGL